jgi:hypothetical protein
MIFQFGGAALDTERATLRRDVGGPELGWSVLRCWAFVFLIRPGGQFINLKEQAKSLGLARRWPEVARATVANPELTMRGYAGTVARISGEDVASRARLAGLAGAGLYPGTAPSAVHQH